MKKIDAIAADFDTKLLVRALVIIAIDLLVLIPGANDMSHDPSSTIGLLFYIPVLVIVNIVAGVLALVFKSKWALLWFLNAVFSPVFLGNYYSYAAERYTDSINKRFYFENNHKHYSLDIDLNDGKYADSLRFAFFELHPGSSWGTGIGGRYVVKHDTLVLLSDSGQIKVLGKVLYGFPRAASRIKMTEEMPVLQ